MSVQPYVHTHPMLLRASIPSVPMVQEDTSSDYIHAILHLLWIGQALAQETTEVVEHLCLEVQSITQGKAQLIPRSEHATSQLPAAMPDTLISFSVQFGTTVYGTLCIGPSHVQPTSPAMPYFVGQLIAQVCGWLLFTFEQSVFLRKQCQRFTEQPYGALTRREREVLKLMCLGLDQKSIADKLCISPTTVSKHRQHIYEQLGVHNEHDAQLAAYHFGLFSIIE